MSERINILKNKFEKRLRKFKDKAVLVNENIKTATEKGIVEELELGFFQEEMTMEKVKRFNKAKKKVKMAEKNLKSCLEKGNYETELEGIKVCSEKYENLAIAYLNLASLSIEQAEIAGIKAIAASMESNRRKVLEENDLD